MEGDESWTPHLTPGAGDEAETDSSDLSATHPDGEMSAVLLFDPRSLPATYVGLLELSASRWGPIGAALVERDRRRAISLSMFTTDHDSLTLAIGSVADALAWFSETPGLHPDLVSLLSMAVADRQRGVESVLSDVDPRPLDESRHLMEIEALLAHFARVPDDLQRWIDIEPHRRHNAFGFGTLTREASQAMNIPAGQIVAQRDEYASHSTALHPAPRGEYAAPAGDEMSGMFADLGDLLQHGVRVLDEVPNVFEVVLEPGTLPPPRPRPNLGALPRARQLIERFMDVVGVPEEMRERTPRPSDSLRPRDGTIAAREGRGWHDPTAGET